VLTEPSRHLLARSDLLLKADQRVTPRFHGGQLLPQRLHGLRNRTESLLEARQRLLAFLLLLPQRGDFFVQVAGVGSQPFDHAGIRHDQRCGLLAEPMTAGFELHDDLLGMAAPGGRDFEAAARFRQRLLGALGSGARITMGLLCRGKLFANACERTVALGSFLRDRLELAAGLRERAFDILVPLMFLGDLRFQVATARFCPLPVGPQESEFLFDACESGIALVELALGRMDGVGRRIVAGAQRF